jgi:hypothetical protein
MAAKLSVQKKSKLCEHRTELEKHGKRISARIRRTVGRTSIRVPAALRSAESGRIVRDGAARRRRRLRLRAPAQPAVTMLAARR